MLFATLERILNQTRRCLDASAAALPGIPLTGAAAESLLGIWCARRGCPLEADCQASGTSKVFQAFSFSAGLWKRKVRWSLSMREFLLSAVIKEAMFLEIVPFFIISLLLRTPCTRYFELNSWVLKILITVIYWRTPLQELVSFEMHMF